MIIVAGQIRVPQEDAQDFVDSSLAAVTQARNTEGCLDFVVAADPLEPDRINVYEAWESEEALMRFRGEGPQGDLSSLILEADVRRYEVYSSEHA